MAGPPSDTATADGERRSRAYRAERVLLSDPEREWFADEVAHAIGVPSRGMGATLAALHRRGKCERTVDHAARCFVYWKGNL